MPTPSPTPSLSPEAPDAAYFGSAKAYLDTIDAVHRRPLCIYVLKLLAKARQDKREDGEALSVLADLEIVVQSHFTESEPPVKTVWANTL